MAQQVKDIVPPAPEAASLGLFGQFQLGHFTGTVDVSIPIYELKGKQLSHSISLKYNSSGVLMEEISPWVGANWGLIAGGLITQNVRGIADNKGLFLNPLPQIQDPYQIGGWDLMQYYNNFSDSEPDIFTYSFANFSGKFIFNDEILPITIPRQPIQIKPNIVSNEIESWRILDEKGNQYYFNTTTNRMINGSGLTASKTWYLNIIVSPDNLDTLYISYDIFPCNYAQLNNSQSISYGGYESVYQGDIVNGGINVSESNAYITEIRSSTGTISFKNISRHDNQINNLKQLDQILIFDNESNVIKNLKFNYINTGERLFLTKIQDMITNPAIDLYEFYYHNTNLPVRFSSNTGIQRSFAIDYWGYYNGKVSNTHLIPQVSTQIPHFSPADRTSNINYAIMGALEKIVYPTKGYTRFYYDLNETKLRPLFYGTNIPYSPSYKVGGLRISKVEDYDYSNKIIKEKSYDYQSQGKLTSVPIYFYDFESNMGKDGCTIGYNGVALISSNSQAYLNSIQGSHIVYPKVKEIYGATGEDGYSIFEYSTDEIFPTEFMLMPPFVPSDEISYYRAGLLKKQTDYGAFGNILKEIINEYKINENLRDTVRGLKLLRSKEVYIELPLMCSTCCPFRAEEDDDYYLKFYNIISGWQNKISDTVRLYNSTDESKFHETINSYNYNNPLHQQLSSQITYSSLKEPIISNFLYSSDAASGAPPQMHDKNNANYKHMLSSMVEENILVNGREISKVYTKYVYDSDRDLVLRDYDQIYPDGSTSFKLRYSYNHKGKLVEFYKENDIKTAFIWDNIGINVLAKIQNASSNAVAYTSFEDEFSTGGWNYNEMSIFTNLAYTGNNFLAGDGTSVSTMVPSGNYIVGFCVKKSSSSNGSVVISGISSPITVASSTWEYKEVELNNASSVQLTVSGVLLDELRLYPKGAQMTTYTYKPLVGMTSQTDPNGLAIIYEYDSFGRLSQIRDHNDNIIKKYDYHYAGQPVNN